MLPVATLAPADLLAALKSFDLLEPEQFEELEALPFGPRAGEALAWKAAERGWLTSYQVERLLEGRGRELALGGYRLLAPLGEGGMGQVFKAVQRRLGRAVAVKVIHQDYLANRPEAIRRFHREARAAAQLSHPNAIRIYDADQDGGRHFIVMELVEGLDLARLVERGGPLPAAVACEYVAQAALGLHHAHELGMIHRDVKPSNLLVARVPSAARAGVGDAPLLEELRRAGLVKVLDLGLARVAEQADGASALTTEGNVMGTPDFIAPEQARNPHGVDGRADLYSLGCTLYYLLAGRPPFPESSALEKLLMHQCDEPLPLEALRSGTPEAVSAVVRRLMAKAPGDRFQSALETHAVLRQLAAELAASCPELPAMRPGEGVATTPAMNLRLTPLPPAASTPGRTPLRSPSGLSRLEPLGQEWKSLETAESASGGDGPASLNLQWGAEPQGATAFEATRHPEAPSHGAFPTPSPGPLPTPSVMWDRPLEESGRPPAAKPVAALRGHVGCVVSLAFSNDGEVLASGGVDGSIRLWSTRQGDSRQTAQLQTEGGEVHALAFAPDDGRLAFGVLDGHAWIWDLADPLAKPPLVRELILPGRLPYGSTLKQVRKAAAARQERYPPIFVLAFSADGKALALGSGPALHLFHTPTEGPKPWLELAGHTGDISAAAFAPDGKRLASAGKDGTLRLWEPHRYFRKLQSAMKASEVGRLSFAPDGRMVAFNNRKSHQVWGVAAAEPQRLAKFEDCKGNVRLLQFQARGEQLLAADDQGCIYLRDLSTGVLLASWSVPFLKTFVFAVSPDGRLLAAGEMDGQVSLYRLEP